MKLIICEKPGAGQAIAAALGVKGRRDGYIENSEHIVSWCIGHLLCLAHADAYDGKYAKWRYGDLPIIPEKWQHVAAQEKKKQLKIVTTLMNRADVDTIINGCDAGREGELIFRLVYEYSGCKKPIQRLWISSMEDAAIRAGFANLRPGTEYDNLYAAALCRERADWLVGINGSRLFSTLYQHTLNIGRVQSPTLAMLVQREAGIASFVKEPFYTPVIIAGDISASGEKTKEKAAAECIRAECDNGTAIVKSVERVEKTIAPPKLYDLTTLQREANRFFGFTAKQTLDYTQALYEKKLCTYPRTDSRYLTEDMAAGIPALVDLVAKIVPGIDGRVEISPEVGPIIDNTRVSDHHAIIPTKEVQNANLTALPSGERDVLLLIITRLLCATAQKHVYEAVTATLECAGNTFTAKGKAVLSVGWKAFGQWIVDSGQWIVEDEEDEAGLLDLVEGQAFENITASVKEGHTSPPKQFTEDTLLSAMETAGAGDMPDEAERQTASVRKGLGTPATRASVIEKLVKSGFVQRRGRQIIPADKGKNLVTILPESVKSPELTAEWEHGLQRIQRGELDAHTFMQGTVQFITDLVRENNAPVPEYAALFPPLIHKKGEIIGKCPRCGSDVREREKGFFCDSPMCGFRLWRDNKFFAIKKKPLDTAIITALLKDGCIHLEGMHSPKTGKTYAATIVMEAGAKGDKYVNFSLKFDEKAGKKA